MANIRELMKKKNNKEEMDRKGPGATLVKDLIKKSSSKK